MNQLDTTTEPHRDPLDEAKLLDTIRQLEIRVRELEAGRDSAYEKALVRAYEQVLTGCRTQLATRRTA